jgi:hypothetical protein
MDEPGARVIGLGFRLAELIEDLKRRQDARDYIYSLNEAFDALRRCSAAALERQEAAEALKNELERVAEQFPDLVSKSADLQSQIDQWARQLSLDGELPI